MTHAESETDGPIEDGLPPASQDEDEADGDVSQKIVRDTGFSHKSADSGVFILLGHDAEISFLRSEPIPRERITNAADEEKEGFKMENLLSEVVRVRLPPAAATHIAMNILGRLAREDFLDRDAVQSSFEEIITAIDQAEQSNSESS